MAARPPTSSRSLTAGRVTQIKLAGPAAALLVAGCSPASGRGGSERVMRFTSPGVGQHMLGVRLRPAGLWPCTVTASCAGSTIITFRPSRTVAPVRRASSTTQASSCRRGMTQMKSHPDMTRGELAACPPFGRCDSFFMACVLTGRRGEPWLKKGLLRWVVAGLGPRAGSVPGSIGMGGNAVGVRQGPLPVPARRFSI
jgi:hypothetical protein